MLKPLALSLALLALATYASYIDYSINSSTDVISNGSGLEWLTLPNTVSYSVEDALAEYANDGWFVASSEHVDILFDDFFGAYDWTTDRGYRVDQRPSMSETSSTNEGVDYFLDLFGRVTLDDWCFENSSYTCVIDGERLPRSQADFYFASHEFNVEEDTSRWTFNVARITSQYNQAYSNGALARTIQAGVSTNAQFPMSYTSVDGDGAIALTRYVPTGTPSDPNPGTPANPGSGVSVPEPGPLFLFATMPLMLAFRKFRQGLSR